MKAKAKRLRNIMLSVFLLACQAPEADPNDLLPNDVIDGPEIVSEKQNFKIDTLATGLNNPWGLAFLPDGRLLVTERNGDIRVIQNRTLLAQKIQQVPAVYQNGQGGLLDIQLHPQYASNGWIYLCYAKPVTGGGGTALARAKLNGLSLVEVQELFVAQPGVNSGVHFGSRIAFDGKGYVYVSTGDRGTMQNAQNLGNHWGKIIRLHDDGRVPADNPFVSTSGARPEIWSYGHRNVQGLAFDAATQTLWAHEHGPQGGDELNRIEKGKNYGWPVITYGRNYNGTVITTQTHQAGMEQPVYQWTPSIAPCGLTVVTSARYPAWRGNLLVGALAHRHVARVEINALGQYVRQEKLLVNFGRVRAVAQSPDGYLFVATESPGMVVRCVPVQ